FLIAGISSKKPQFHRENWGLTGESKRIVNQPAINIYLRFNLAEKLALDHRIISAVLQICRKICG
ncbi:TPA: hypothetical protein ACIJR0_002963, partial [Klebsiella aerogenes]